MRIFALAILTYLPVLCSAQEVKKPSVLNAFLDKHCIECHDSSLTEGELDLTRVSRDVTDPAILGLWTRIHDRIENGEMPPAKKPRPAAAELEGAIASLQKVLQDADAALAKVVLRRLNRDEYENTVRVLFGIRAEVREILPEDAKSHGFATIGEALGVSTELMHAYLDAADVVMQETLGTGSPPKPVDYRYHPSDIASAGRGYEKYFLDHPEGVVMFRSQNSVKKVVGARIATKGTYRVRFHAMAYQSDRPTGLQVRAGDVNVGRRPFWVQGLYDAPVGKMGVFEFDEFLYPGDGVSFSVVDERSAGGAYNKTDAPGVVLGEVTIEGPLEPWPPESRERLLDGTDPVKGTEADLRRILDKILPRAFRRPISPGQQDVYVNLGRQVLQDGKPFTEALAVSLKALLTSPSFLFLEEPTAADAPRRINDYALASRLSFLLWSSMPDDALFQAAAAQRLSTPDGLRAETERMLKDPKAAAFTQNFIDQWLNLAEFDATSPDTKLYPEFNAALRFAMLEETRLYFTEVLENDRSITEFIDSDWTYVNRSLATLYGLPGIDSMEMARIQLPAGSSRGGLLTQASVLKTTANGTNTSPIVRGIWVLEKILGKTPPPPPPAVPAIEPDSRGATSIRDLLEKHRESKACNSCHAQIDPPGFALESFDVMGGERDWYRVISDGAPRVRKPLEPGSSVSVAYSQGPPVDPSGMLPSGVKFENVRDLKKIIASNPDQIARNLAEKLLTYGTGRIMGFSDRGPIDQVVAKSRASGHRFRSLLHEVVQSDQFRRP